MSELPWLSDAEIEDLCAGLKGNFGRIKFLRSLGLTVAVKPNGKPIVIREHVMNVLSGLPPPVITAPIEKPRNVPNREALIQAFSKKPKQKKVAEE